MIKRRGPGGDTRTGEGKDVRRATRALFVIFLVCDCIGESLCVVNQINIMCRELDLCFLTCVMCDGHVR